VVECKDSLHFYVGSSVRELWSGPHMGGSRLEEHRQGWGSKFTARHGFKRVLFITDVLASPVCSRLEHQLTRWLWHQFGWRHARGGNLTNMRHDCAYDRWWMPPEFKEDPEHPGSPPKWSEDLLSLVHRFWEGYCPDSAKRAI
jgi:predicted GIY-YIG superfamily endonuclease